MPQWERAAERDGACIVIISWDLELRAHDNLAGCCIFTGDYAMRWGIGMQMKLHFYPDHLPEVGAPSLGVSFSAALPHSSSFSPFKDYFFLFLRFLTCAERRYSVGRMWLLHCICNQDQYEHINFGEQGI